MEESRVDAMRIMICAVFGIESVAHFDYMDQAGWRKFVERYETTILSAIDALQKDRLADTVRRRIGIGRRPQTFYAISADFEVSTTRVQQIYKEALRRLRLLTEGLGPIAKELLEMGYDTRWTREVSRVYEAQQQLADTKLIANTVLAYSGQFLIDHSKDCSTENPCATCRARQLLRDHDLEEQVLSLYEEWCHPNLLDMAPHNAWPDLSFRATNALKDGNIKSVRQLLQKTELGLLRTPNFGRKSLNEIKEKLQELGLKFRE